MRAFVWYDEDKNTQLEVVRKYFKDQKILVVSKENFRQNGGRIGTDDPIFPSVSSLALHFCRQLRLIWQERSVFLPLDDLFRKICLYVKKRNSELMENDEFNISEVLDIFRKLKELKNSKPPETHSISDELQKLAEECKKNMKKCNIFDQFDLLNLVKKDLTGSQEDEEERLLPKAFESFEAILVINPDFGSHTVELELLSLLTEENVSKITIESSLDASINRNDSRENELIVSSEPFNQDVDVKKCPTENESGRTSSYCIQLIHSYFRVLVNSRDEFALVYVLCGPCGEFSHKQFDIIRKEANKTGMPMYQTIFSYVQKLELGGKSYAPKDNHQFKPFEKPLQSFIALMERLHTKIEDSKDIHEGLTKVCNILQGQVLKSATLKASGVNEAFDFIKFVCSNSISAMTRYSSFGTKTPKRDVGAGGSVAGRNILKALREVTDEIAGLSIGELDIHRLLGKIPVSKDYTPLTLPILHNLFKTPEYEKNGVTKHEEDLKVEQNKSSRPKPFKNKASKKAMMGCSYSWAMETSPIMQTQNESLSLPEEECVVPNSTIVCMGKEASTPVSSKRPNIESSELDEKIVIAMKKARVDLEEIKKATKESRKLVPKKPKRSLLSDLTNFSQRPKSEAQNKETNKAEATAKSTTKVSNFNGKENRNSCASKTNKKTKPIPKGQRLITGFFRI